jgi:hypothetical protein
VVQGLSYCKDRPVGGGDSVKLERCSSRLVEGRFSPIGEKVWRLDGTLLGVVTGRLEMFFWGTRSL